MSQNQKLSVFSWKSQIQRAGKNCCFSHQRNLKFIIVSYSRRKSWCHDQDEEQEIHRALQTMSSVHPLKPCHKNHFPGQAARSFSSNKRRRTLWCRALLSQGVRQVLQVSNPTAALIFAALIDQHPGASNQYCVDDTQWRSYTVQNNPPIGAGKPSVKSLIDIQPSTSQHQISCIAMELLMDWSEIDRDIGHNSGKHRDDKKASNEPLKFLRLTGIYLFWC